MIKRYKEFVKESIEDYFDNRNSYTRDDIRELRDNWVDEVMNVSLEIGSYSFSELCRKDNVFPEEDYKEFQNRMDSKGFPFDLIKEIFSKESDRLLGSIASDRTETDIFEEIRRSPLDSQNGQIDTYLYFTVKRLGLDYKKVELGGPGWGGIEDYPEEAIIRYSYGYHKTKYGQLMMEQLGITEEEFEEYASKGFCVELINNWYNFFRCKIEDFVIIEEDRIVIFTKKLSDYLVNSIEEVNNNLTKFMNLYSFIEYDITENEFLIHCESDKRYLINNT